MVIELFLLGLKKLISLILSPIQFAFEPLGSALGLIELLSYASIFIPFTTLASCLAIWLAIYVLKFGFTLANWVIGKIPTIS